MVLSIAHFKTRYSHNINEVNGGDKPLTFATFF